MHGLLEPGAGLGGGAEAEAIFIGVNAVDYSGYPGCRPEFIETFQALARLATRQGVEGRPVRVEAPLFRLRPSPRSFGRAPRSGWTTR